MVELNQLKKQQNRKNMKCKVASKVIAASNGSSNGYNNGWMWK